MKAILLAAGKGERLKSMTASTPKPMLAYRNKPLLQHNIELCLAHGVTELYVNLHHFPEVILDAFGDGSDCGVSLRYSYEKELLGTAGAVKRIVAELWNPDNRLSNPATDASFAENNYFFVIYADNYSNCDFPSLLSCVRNAHSIGAIAFHYRDDVSHSGVAEFDGNDRILSFIEKPKPGQTTSHWVNAGIYLLRRDIVDLIPEGNCDFGKDVFPGLLQMGIELFGVKEMRDVKAFDTVDMYRDNIDD